MLTSTGAETLTYDPANGLLTGTTLGVVTDSLTYNGFAEADSYTANINASTIFTTSFMRDKLGRISQKTETVQGVTHVFDYTYDTAGRLTNVDRDSLPFVSYTYDSNGNRLNNGAVYDDQDRLLSQGSATYTYAAQVEKRVLQTRAQALEAFRKTDRPRFPIRVGQHKMVEQMIEASARNRHPQLRQTAKIRLRKNGRMMDLREINFPGRTIQSAPTLHLALKRSQLTVGEVARKAALKIKKKSLRLQTRIQTNRLSIPSQTFENGSGRVFQTCGFLHSLGNFPSFATLPLVKILPQCPSIPGSSLLLSSSKFHPKRNPKIDPGLMVLFLSVSSLSVSLNPMSASPLRETISRRDRFLQSC